MFRDWKADPTEVRGLPNSEVEPCELCEFWRIDPGGSTMLYGWLGTGARLVESEYADIVVGGSMEVEKERDGTGIMSDARVVGGEPAQDSDWPDMDGDTE